MKYPDVPECPVLVLGFLQNLVDDYDWKVIGVINYIDEDVTKTEAQAAANICYMSMPDLRKEYAWTNSCVLEEVAEFYMSSHPTISMYHVAMAHIRSWLQKTTSWLPRYTWRQRLQTLYPMQFKVINSKQAQPKACVKCSTMGKQLDKAHVSSMSPLAMSMPQFVPT